MLTNISVGKIAAAALALTIVAAPAFGHGPGPYGPGQGRQGSGPGMMSPYMMGPGMMSYGQGWTGPGGMHHGPGWMAPGMHHGPGWMGHGGMHHGPGWTSPGMGGYGFGRGALRQDLAVDDVKHILEHRLQWQGFTNLRVGDIAEKDDDTLTAEVVTGDGAVVQRFEVNRHTGAFSPVQ